MKFKDFQAPVLFSSTFKALNLEEKIQVLSRMRGNPVDSGIRLTTSRSLLKYTSVLPRLRTATWFSCPIPHTKNTVLLLIML